MNRNFEARILDTLSELARQCQSMSKRSSTVAELAGNQAALGIYSQYARTFGERLDKAYESIESLVEQREERTTLGPSPLRIENLDLKKTSGNMMNLTNLPNPAGSIAKQAALKGSGSLIGIPDVIGFLAGLSASGTLRVTTLDESFTMLLQDGLLTHAISDNTPDGQRLGDVLVEQGAISEKRLKSFLLRNRNSPRKLGEALMLEEQVTERELRAALEEQVRRLFVRLFESDGASFEFLEGLPPGEPNDLRMSLPGLLLESATAFDEAHRQAS
ncbi:MAG: DUF4388 domain-containing protein [Planctomycetes bacterium]|nr:DUF4388 domain-containing protein [Planctomycetota bacterium]